MSDTPRTDYAEESQLVQYVNQAECGWPSFPADFEFARKLERELTDAHHTIESLRASLRELVGLLECSAAQNALQRAKDLLP